VRCLADCGLIVHPRVVLIENYKQIFYIHTIKTQKKVLKVYFVGRLSIKKVNKIEGIEY
jgi:hypothetical protein